ncbi:MAG: hypothetical protein COB61_009210 [Thiotrichales bacterium]|nr:hypothetical protein [Thiotrichales bacterium]
MKNVTNYIEQKKLEFYNHVFFERFKKGEDIREVLQYSIGFGFWIMTFQDVLRLNTARFSDPSLKPIAEKHMAEDSGHDLWYLSDLTMMGLNIPTIHTIYQSQFSSSRDASYLLINEALNTKNDLERLILIEAIESTSDVFFGWTSDYVENLNITAPLRFFSKYHFNVEQSHDCEEFEHIFETTVLSEEEERDLIALVDRTYEAFDILYTGIDVLMKKGEKIQRLIKEDPGNLVDWEGMASGFSESRNTKIAMEI